MIASVTGVLAQREPAGIVVETPGGTGYLIYVPLGVFERLPQPGASVHLHTELVVREDDWSLYGFDSTSERTVFRRLLAASGVGARLAISILSALGPERTVRAVRDRDLAALGTVSGIGRKKAERIVLELADRLDDLPAAEPIATPAADAVRALVALGYPQAAADTAVRNAASPDATDTPMLLRRALSDLQRK
ncbi:MAG: Holliday junction branch migration protein RuvA [Gemmatimonadales bacterium]|nr:Holliday junction branch migration protein RuvA [Gemmatimonadales bacterium]